MTENLTNYNGYLRKVKGVLADFKSRLDSTPERLYQSNSESDSTASDGDNSYELSSGEDFDNLWLRDLPDDLLGLLSALQRAMGLPGEDQKIDKVNEDLTNLIVKFLDKIPSDKITIVNNRSEKTEKVIATITEFRKFNQSIDKILQSINAELSQQQNISDIANIDEQKVPLAQAEPVLSTKKSVSSNSIDANKKEEEEIKAKKAAEAQKIRLDLDDAKKEQNRAQKIEKYKTCLSNIFDFIDHHFDNTLLLEIAAQISSDQVTFEVFAFRNNPLEVVKAVDPANQTLSSKILSAFGVGKSAPDLNQNKLQKSDRTLFYKILHRLDPNSQILFISAISKQDLRQLLLSIEPKKDGQVIDLEGQRECNEINQIVELAKLRHENAVKEALGAAIKLSNEPRKNALINCLNEAIDFAARHDDQKILLEVAFAVCAIKFSTNNRDLMINSDQASIFGEKLHKIFELIDDAAKQKLITKMSVGLMHKLADRFQLPQSDNIDNQIRALLDAEIARRGQQEKDQQLKNINSKLEVAKGKSGQDKIDILVDYLISVTDFITSYGHSDMIVNALSQLSKIITPAEQATILISKIGDKTLFHQMVVSTKTEEYMKLFPLISNETVNYLLPLANPKLPEDKKIIALLKSEQQKRHQQEKAESEARKKQQQEEAKQQKAQQEAKKKQQQEEAEARKKQQQAQQRESQIATLQQKEEDARIMREKFSALPKTTTLDDQNRRLVAECLNLAIDYADKYKDKNRFDAMIGLISSYRSSDIALILKGFGLVGSQGMICKAIGLGRSDLLPGLINLLSKDTDGRLQTTLNGRDDNNPLAKALEKSDMISIGILLKAGATSLRINNYKAIVTLHNLFENGNPKTALKLLSLMADDQKALFVSHKDADNKTIFHRLTKSGQIDLMAKVIELVPQDKKSAILDLQDNEGQAALHLAAQRKNGIISATGKQAAELLLKHGANPNIANNYGKIPLHLAAEHGRAKTVKMMVANKGDLKIDTKDNEEMTALHKAAEHNHPKSAEALLKAGANPYLADKKDKTVLEYGLEKGSRFFTMMVRKANPEYKFEDQDGQPKTAAQGFFSLLKTAIKSKVANSVFRILIKQDKYDFTPKDQAGNNALHLAVLNDDIKATTLLLQHGADSIIHQKNDAGKSVRELANHSKNPAIVKIFSKIPLTPNENLRDLALKVKAENESEKQNFEQTHFMVAGIVWELGKSIVALDDKKNSKAEDRYLREQLFGGNLFALGLYFSQFDAQKNKEFHNLIGIEYRDGSVIIQDQLLPVIENDTKRQEIVNFIKKFADEFEIKAKIFGAQKQMQESLVNIVGALSKCDVLSNLEYSSRDPMRGSDIFSDFSVKNENGKIILSYNHIDYTFQEQSSTRYQILIDPKKSEILISQNGDDQKPISFADLSKLVLNLDNFNNQIDDLAKKFRDNQKRLEEEIEEDIEEKNEGEDDNNENGRPSTDLHANPKQTLHHTHKNIADDNNVAIENFPKMR